MWLNDLDVALRDGGIGFWESPGWKGRGHGAMSGKPRGVMIHHTAGGGSNDWKVVQNGRPGLDGPLAHMTLERDGGVRLLAAGLCWHAGAGSWRGVTSGNNWFIGIEGVSRGVGDDWTSAQRREYPRVAAALARHYGFPVEMIVGHKEYATPRGRKIDPGNWDMNAFRADAAKYLSGGGQAPVSEDDELRQDERDALFDIREQLTGSRAVGQYPGWPSWRWGEGNGPATMVDLIRAIDQNLNSRYTLENRPADAEADDTGTGQLLSLRAEVRALADKLDKIAGK